MHWYSCHSDASSHNYPEAGLKRQIHLRDDSCKRMRDCSGGLRAARKGKCLSKLKWRFYRRGGRVGLKSLVFGETWILWKVPGWRAGIQQGEWLRKVGRQVSGARVEFLGNAGKHCGRCNSLEEIFQPLKTLDDEAIQNRCGRQRGGHAKGNVGEPPLTPTLKNKWEEKEQKYPPLALICCFTLIALGKQPT